jgi:hypothetical protein
MARPKGSKTKHDGQRNRVLAKAAKYWEKRFKDATTDAERDFAMVRLTKIGISQNSLKKSAVVASGKQKVKAAIEYNPAEPEPECLRTCGHISCAQGCPRDGWKARQDAYYDANPELKPKPEPAPVAVFVEPDTSATTESSQSRDLEPRNVPLDITAPKIARPAPALVDTFWSDFKSKPIYERNMILRTLNPARQVEWELMQEEQRLKAARAMAAMPKETPKPVSEIEKAAVFAPPIMIQPRPTGQPQTVDEVRETFGSTMGTATPDSGLSPELDRRSWLPNLNPLIHK